MKSTGTPVRTYTGFRAALELMRPANIVTAFADILAGFSASGSLVFIPAGMTSASQEGLLWLLLSTFGLYGGGVVFNDFFDAGLDAAERPERPIPGGRITKRSAGILGGILLCTGILAAFMVTGAAGFIALSIALLALFYNRFAKHSPVWGPLFMGFCRGGNLLLGVAAAPLLLSRLWPLALVPVAYIGSITLISQGEVTGGNRRYGNIALLVVLLIAIVLPALAFLLPDYQLLPALPFATLFILAVIPPFYRAASNPGPQLVRRAVRRGILSLIILNSTLAAGFAGPVAGILVLLLLPLSILLARTFAVT